MLKCLKGKSEREKVRERERGKMFATEAGKREHRGKGGNETGTIGSGK